MSGNTASSDGGAIYGTASFSENGSVELSGNTSLSSGGAIYCTKNLYIRNNDSVLFEKNLEHGDDGYRLRSLYVDSPYSYYDRGTVSFSAAAGKKIEFRDSIYIGSNTTFELNADYDSASQSGDIIFTGAYTAKHLAAMKGSAGTASEILNSQTSEVYTLTKLYGGRLLVEEGAVYQGRGITAMEGSASTVRVKNATLNQREYGLTFNSGTKLELAGSNTLVGDVYMESGSWLAFNGEASTCYTVLNGNLTISDTIYLAFDSFMNEENQILLQVEGDVSGWNPDNVELLGSNTSVSNATWLDNWLVLNYNEATFPRYLNGDILFNERTSSDLKLRHYGNVTFDYIITPESSGGAFDASELTIEKSRNVLFSSNSVTSWSYCSQYGGAVYSDYTSLNSNESVTFRGNFLDVKRGGQYANRYDACGGAIASTGTIRENGSVLFIDNELKAEDYAKGGAMYVLDTNGFAITGNGSVSFRQNKASSTTSAYGGAVAGTSLTLTDNGSVLFSKNSVASTSSESSMYKAFGGAISVSGDLRICNNDSVVFEKNVERIDSTYQLRSIYIDSDTSEVFLSAAADKSITFRDAIYIDSDKALSLNADFDGIRQEGDIIFTGSTTVDDLKEMKNGHNGTAAEVTASRTSEIYTMTNLYGGRLIVQDGAVYRCTGITAMQNSNSTVQLRNASLIQANERLNSLFEFHRGTTLSLFGSNTIDGELLRMHDGSTLTFNLSGENAGASMLTYSGLVARMGCLNIQINLEEPLVTGEYKLLSVSRSVGNWWDEDYIIVNGGELTLNDLRWENNVLYFVYDGQDIPIIPGEPEIPETPVEPEAPAVLKLVWAGEKKAVWKVGAAGWTGGKAFENGAAVTFNGNGAVNLEGKVAPSSITVDTDKSLTIKTNKKNPGSISGEGSLIKNGKGTLTLNDGNTGWGGPVILNGGTIKVTGNTSLGKGEVKVQGGTLNLGGKTVSNAIVQSGSAAIKSGKKFTGTYTLEKGGELQKGSTLNISKLATLTGGTVAGALSGTGEIRVTGKVTLADSAKITTNKLTLSNSSILTTSAKGLSMKAKIAAITLSDNSTLKLAGKLSANSLKIDDATLTSTSVKPSAVSLKGTVTLMNDASMSINGKLSAVNLDMRDSSFSLLAAKPQSIALKGDARLTDSYLSVAGKFNAHNLSLSNSSMELTGGKPQNLTVKGALTLGSDSRLSLNGKLSAGSLTLQSGSTLSLSGSKPATIAVKGALTLNSGSSIILDYDFAVGKTYKILTFKTCNMFSEQALYDIFGMDETDCILTNDGKSITLTMNSVRRNQKSVDARSEAVATAIDEEDESSAVVSGTEAGEAIVISGAQAVDNTPVADALVQANWGQLEASRAFVNAVANRSYATLLGNGERAVWASALGASSRHSSAGGHAGADTNISGGAMGLETQVGSASLFGMALGSSRTRVSAHGFSTIKQDTTHLGLYGQSSIGKGMTAEWSGAYGRSESETMGSEWKQNHLQLDGRLSYNHELSEGTVLRGFGGMQYYASNAASVEGTNVGSLQNVRAELGVGASHRTGKLGLYGEVAVHQDIARNNPVVEMDGNRYHGMNPGRTGLNFTVGASYELSDKWSVNASYTGEVVENANAHSANIGATYKF